LSLAPTVRDALRALDTAAPAPISVSDQLLPVAGAVRHARDVATGACLSWDLPDLIGPVCLVVSELVSNAVEHAGTMMTLRVARGTRHVHIAVRDGSSAEPVLNAAPGVTERGRGLLLVDAVALHWGWLPADDGKVVWASLRE